MIGGDIHEYPYEREGIDEWLFTHARGAQLDGTDYTMILNVVSENPEASVLYKAMDCNNYARYWHGYLLFLRPMMLLFSYMQIRYIYVYLYAAWHRYFDKIEQKIRKLYDIFMGVCALFYISGSLTLFTAIQFCVFYSYGGGICH